MWTTFGGKVADLEVWLKEERFPDGWEPACRYSFGHPMLVSIVQHFDCLQPRSNY